MHTKYNTLSTSKYFYITSGGTKKNKMANRDSTASTAARLWAGWTTKESCFSSWNFSNLSTMALGFTQPSFQQVLGVFCRRVKQQWCEADQSPLPSAKHKKEGCYNSTLQHASMQCMGLTLPLPLCWTYFISSMVALFIGSICNIWHSMLTTDLFRYSGMGKIPAITTVNSCHFLTDNKNTTDIQWHLYALLLLYVGQLHKFFPLSGSYEIQSG